MKWKKKGINKNIVHPLLLHFRSHFGFYFVLLPNRPSKINLKILSWQKKKSVRQCNMCCFELCTPWQTIFMKIPLNIQLFIFSLKTIRRTHKKKINYYLFGIFAKSLTSDEWNMKKFNWTIMFFLLVFLFFFCSLLFWWVDEKKMFVESTGRRWKKWAHKTAHQKTSHWTNEPKKNNENYTFLFAVFLILLYSQIVIMANRLNEWHTITQTRVWLYSLLSFSFLVLSLLSVRFFSVTIVAWLFF